MFCQSSYFSQYRPNIKKENVFTSGLIIIEIYESFFIKILASLKPKCIINSDI